MITYRGDTIEQRAKRKTDIFFLGVYMKTENENKKFEEMGQKAVDLIKVAYPECNVSVVYDKAIEMYTFYIDDRTYDVNVSWDSVKAGLRDIANQLLTKNLEG